MFDTTASRYLKLTSLIKVHLLITNTLLMLTLFSELISSIKNKDTTLQP